MYDQKMRGTVSRRSTHTARESFRQYGRSQQRGRSQEQVRLVQLVICLALFFTIFVGKGVFPKKMVDVRNNILEMISQDFNFQAALTSLGQSLAGSDSVLSDLGEFCIEVFGAAPADDPARPADFVPPQPEAVLASELQFLGQAPDAAMRRIHYADLSAAGLEVSQLDTVEEPPTEEVAEPEPPPAVPAAGTVVVVSDYSGQALPADYTMDQLSLGELETTTPVLGHLNSVYGYRDHPINGKYQFHGGVDIGGQMGEPIAAFAAGTVEYTGENDSYGLYFQIDHGNGVKSFYAHCSKVLVSKGQAVELGQTVGEVGSSGAATGPHLHLELKYGQMHLNPAYYVDFAEV